MNALIIGAVLGVRLARPQPILVRHQPVVAGQHQIRAGTKLHPLGMGLIEIGAHCPNMARIARSRLARISTHLARSSGSHTNSDTLVGMPFSSVWYPPRHLSYLLNQRNVLCLNRNHLFRSIRLRFAHNALPTNVTFRIGLSGNNLRKQSKHIF